jgi:hypothetical protein
MASKGCGKMPNETTLESGEIAIKSIVYSYINFSNYYAAYTLINKKRKAKKMEMRFNFLVDTVKLPFENRYTEVLRRLLVCGSIYARFNAAVHCLDHQVYIDKALSVLEEIANNEDIGIFNLRAKTALQN